MSSCPPENCCNQTNLPLYPGIGGRLVQFQSPQPKRANIRGGCNESALDVCRLIFHPDEPIFNPAVPTKNADRTDPQAGSGASPEAQTPTNTATPKSDTPTSIGIGNQVSNRTRPMEGQIIDQELAADCDSDVTSATSYGANDNNSDYVELCEHLSARSGINPELMTIIE